MTERSGADPLITSRRNPRVVDARKLAARKHRQRQGRFLVEGLQLLRMGLEAGARPREAFFCPERAEGEATASLLSDLAGAGAQVRRVSPDVLAALSDRDAPQGLLATFDLLDRPLAALPLPGDGLVLVLDRLQDPGNLGTLLRTADAAGAAAAILLEPCVDPFDPKAVRGSMGSLFHIPFARCAEPDEAFDALRAAGLRAIGADASGGRRWGEGLWAGGVALVLGNEARGLSPDVDAHIQARAWLPIYGAAESLNVAVAGGVLMYAWRRAREEATVRGSDGSTSPAREG